LSGSPGILPNYRAPVSYCRADDVRAGVEDLYARAYADAYGADWLDRVATRKQREAWEHKRENETKRRTPSGVVAVPDDELAYAEFYELCALPRLLGLWRINTLASKPLSSSSSLLIRYTTASKARWTVA